MSSSARISQPLGADGDTTPLDSALDWRTTVDLDHPIAVDLNGTLVTADTLHEGFLAGARTDPGQGLKVLGAIREGKAAFKEEVAQFYSLDPALLPYNEKLLTYLREQKRLGRRIGLFTAANECVAQAIAEHLGIFDVVCGSTRETNLSGHNKLNAIKEAFGPVFTYVGNADVDRPIFEAARSVLLVGADDRLRRLVPAGTFIEATFPSARYDLRVWAKALRLEHWSKNVLIFVAPILGLQIASPVVFAQSILLFLLMGLLASGTYLVNDAVDVVADRQHPRKSRRPIAAGLISVRDGLAFAAALVVASFLISALFLPLAGTLALLAYLSMTLAYSVVLKRQPIVDVFMLAALFTVRILAGGTLTSGPISPWLLTFSMLFFLGLAMVKRYAELERVVRTGGSGVVSRGYTANDLPLALAAGIGCSIAAVVIFSIYLINDHYPQAVYGQPEALWAMVPILLLWTLRAWHLTVHGRMDEDPVVFALKDRTSIALGVLVAGALVVAWS